MTASADADDRRHDDVRRDGTAVTAEGGADAVAAPGAPDGAQARLAPGIAAARAIRYEDSGLGWTLAAELLTATLLWGGIGWLADAWLGTAPVLMVIGFVLGNGLGIYLIWLRSNDRFAAEQDAWRARTNGRRVSDAGRTRPGPDAGSDDA